MKNQILYEKQVGFQVAHSREHAILEFVKSISNSFEWDKFTKGTFKDFCKAFTR